MATRQGLRDELRRRLGDTGSAVWVDGELNGFIDYSIKSLYPVYFVRKVGLSTAGTGPIQTLPSAAAKDVYYLGFKRVGTTRIKPLHFWTEGSGDAIVNRLDLNGMQLVWAWTEGWNSPATDGENLTIHREAEEVVLLRAHILAMERLLSSRAHFENYQVLLAVREGVTETDINASITSLRASLQSLESRAIPRPERRQP